jgi:hypothetical protein
MSDLDPGRARRSGNLRRAAIIAACVFLAVAVYAAMALKEKPSPALDLSRSKLTQEEVFRASIEPERGEPGIGPLHAWILTVTTPDGAPVEGANVSVGGGMPDHDHGLPTQPQVTGELGEGRYRVDGVKFTMAGHWELRFDIVTQKGSDEVVFDLDL